MSYLPQDHRFHRLHAYPAGRRPMSTSSLPWGCTCIFWPPRARPTANRQGGTLGRAQGHFPLFLLKLYHCERSSRFAELSRKKSTMVYWECMKSLSKQWTGHALPTCWQSPTHQARNSYSRLLSGKGLGLRILSKGHKTSEQQGIGDTHVLHVV